MKDESLVKPCSFCGVLVHWPITQWSPQKNGHPPRCIFVPSKQSWCSSGLGRPTLWRLVRCVRCQGWQIYLQRIWFHIPIFDWDLFGLNRRTILENCVVKNSSSVDTQIINDASSGRWKPTLSKPLFDLSDTRDFVYIKPQRYWLLVYRCLLQKAHSS